MVVTMATLNLKKMPPPGPVHDDSGLIVHLLEDGPQVFQPNHHYIVVQGGWLHNAHSAVEEGFLINLGYCISVCVAVGVFSITMFLHVSNSFSLSPGPSIFMYIPIPRLIEDDVLVTAQHHRGLVVWEEGSN